MKVSFLFPPLPLFLTIITAHADLKSVGSGDWFTADNWEDPFGNNVIPNNSTQDPVLVLDGHTISLAGGIATTNNQLGIGDGNVGTFNLTGGSLEPGQRLHIGQNGGTGTLTMSGGGIDTPVIIIARQIGSNGTFDLSNGTVDTSTLIVGDSVGIGTMDMSGGTANATNFNVSVNGGRGTFTQSGGILNTVNRANIGALGLANVTLQGNAIWNSGNIQSEDANFTLQGTSQINSSGIVTFKDTALTISDTASLNTTGQLQFDGKFDGQTKGTLVMTAGTISSSGALIAGAPNRVFSADVSGGTITCENGSIGLDADSEATMHFTGGFFHASNIFSDPGDGQLFVGDGGTGTLIFDGDSDLIADNRLLVGRNGGSGRLEMAQTASAIATKFFAVGMANSTGHFEMTGGSLTVAPDGGVSQIDIGEGGFGTAAIGPGVISVNTINVGQSANSNGSLLVREGADIDIAGIFAIGNFADSTGTLNMEGGRIDLSGPDGDLRIGNVGNGTANLSGGIFSSSADITVSTFDGSTGSLNVSGDALLTCPDDMFVAANGSIGNGTVTMTGGRIEVGDVLTAAKRSGDFASFVIGGNAELLVANDANLGDGRECEVEFSLGADGGDPFVNVTDVFNLPHPSADRSKVTVDIVGGTLEARRIGFGGDSIDEAEMTFRQSGGIVRSTTSLLSIDGEGMDYEFSGGELRGGTGIIMGDNTLNNPGAFRFAQSGGLLITPMDLKMFEGFDAFGLFQLSNGEVQVGRDFLIGTEFGTSDSESVFRQSGGTIAVTGTFHNRGEVDQFMTGGSLAAEDFKLEAETAFSGPFGSDPQLFARWNQTGGSVNATQNLSFENAEIDLSGGSISGTNATLGTIDRSDTTVELSGSGRLEISNTLTLGDNVGTAHLAADLIQTGGRLIVDGQLVNNRGGNYDFTAGELTRSGPGTTAIVGDFPLTANASLLLENDKKLTISGSFLPVDTDGTAGNFKGAGAIDVAGLRLEPITDQVQFFPLITVTGDKTNLLTDTALDDIELLNIAGTFALRISEHDFETGNFSQNNMALVEGQNADGDGVIGIAYRIINPATEPVANPDTLVRTAGQSGSISVAELLANDTPENGGTLTLVNVASASSAGQSVTNDGTTITYTPESGFDAADSFNYLVSNGQGISVGTVNVIVIDPDADDDGDGMSNGYELEHFGDLTSGDPNADPDGDGQSNLAEFLALTDPNDPQPSSKHLHSRKRRCHHSDSICSRTKLPTAGKLRPGELHPPWPCCPRDRWYH